MSFFSSDWPAFGMSEDFGDFGDIEGQFALEEMMGMGGMRGRQQSSSSRRSSRSGWRPSSSSRHPSHSDRRSTSSSRRPSLSGRRSSLSGRRPSFSDRRPSFSDRRPSMSDRRSSSSDRRPFSSGRRPSMSSQELTTQSSKPDHFKVLQNLGHASGAFNEAILVIQSRRSGNVYIEKKLDPEMVKQGFAKDEIQILGQMRGHPNVVKMIDSYMSSSSPRASIMFEHCDGGNLDDLIERHSVVGQHITESWLWKALGQMSSAIDFLQNGTRRPIYHLDLKPANILIKSGRGLTPDIKIADFGSAIGGELNTRGTMARDRRFRSPEDNPSGATDIWGVGITMFCLCRLKRLQGGPDRDERGGLVDRSVGRLYTGNLADVVLSCLRANRRDRVSARDLMNLVKMTMENIDPRRLHGVPPILPGRRFA